MKISDIGEFGLISKAESKFRDLIPAGCKGIGDDCAVIPISDQKSMVITTDMLVEGVHFLSDKITPYELGYKSLSVNLSDIAAMGALAHSVFLSIALPSWVTTEWCEDFFEGIHAHGVALMGGDTTKSNDKITINITALGIADSDRIKFRNGAKAGDKIYVTATLGDSAGGLKAILSNKQEDYKTLVKQHNTPRPHLDEGLILGNIGGVTAMMDISDGLASDLKHILKASGVSANVNLDMIPISEELSASPWDSMRLALSGGEDYCLLFTASPEVVIPDSITAYQIGEITSENKNRITWLKNNEDCQIDYNGFVHF